MFFFDPERHNFQKYCGSESKKKKILFVFLPRFDQIARCIILFKKIYYIYLYKLKNEKKKTPTKPRRAEVVFFFFPRRPVSTAVTRGHVAVTITE